MRLLALALACVAPAAAGQCACTSACSGWCSVDAATCRDARRGWVSYWQSCSSQNGKFVIEASLATTQTSEHNLREQAYQRVSQLREYLQSFIWPLGTQSWEKLLLVLQIGVKLGMTSSLDIQDRFWEDPAKKVESPWTGSPDTTRRALDASYAMILLTKRFFYVVADVYFYIAVLTVTHSASVNFVNELWRDILEAIVCVFLLAGLKCSDRFCPAKKFANSFWSLCESKQGSSVLNMTFFALVAPPSISIVLHWVFENSLRPNCAVLLLVFGFMLTLVEYEYYLPYITAGVRQMTMFLSNFLMVGDCLRGAFLSTLSFLESRQPEGEPLNARPEERA